MKQITDFKELSALILKHYKRGVLTNSFLHPDTLKCEIREGRLFVNDNAESLSILLQRDSFDRLYYYAASENTGITIYRETVTESVGNESLLKFNSFEPVGKRCHLVKNKAVEAQPLTSEFAQKEDCEAILKLIKNCFDEKTAALPTLTELILKAENGNVLIFKDSAKTAAVLEYGIYGKTATIDHLCTSPEYRSMGLAKKLCTDFISQNSGRRLDVWTAESNTAALKLYKSLGFEADEKTAIIYKKG